MNNQEILEANKVFTSKSVLINESFSNNTVLWTDKHYRSIADIEEIEKLRAQLKTAKADGMIEVATQRCPVSGFVVSNEKSRLEILDYAESINKGRDCERD